MLKFYRESRIDKKRMNKIIKNDKITMEIQRFAKYGCYC